MKQIWIALYIKEIGLTKKQKSTKEKMPNSDGFTDEFC